MRTGKIKQENIVRPVFDLYRTGNTAPSADSAWSRDSSPPIKPFQYNLLDATTSPSSLSLPSLSDHISAITPIDMADGQRIIQTPIPAKGNTLDLKAPGKSKSHELDVAFIADDAVGAVGAVDGTDRSRYIIKNINHLRKIITEYGTNVFVDKLLSSEMLNFIVDSFIVEPFLYEGRNVGADPNARDMKTLVAQEKQRTTLTIFVSKYLPEIIDDSIPDPMVLSPAQKLGEGTYGVIARHSPGKVLKYVIARDASSNPLYHLDMDMTNHVGKNVLYTWFIEFCTFIIIMSIMKYIDCNLIVDDAKNNICNVSKYQNVFDKDYFLSYFSFMAKVNAPFAKKISGNMYTLGYISEAYTNTIGNLYASLEKEVSSPSTTPSDDFYDAYNLTYQLFDIFHKISHLSNIGINISHRDAHANNIMYFKDPMGTNKFKIRLIDFGFLCTNIKFADGGYVNVGYHPLYKQYNLNVCNKPLIDFVFYMTWCFMFSRHFFDLIKKYTNIDAVESIADTITFHNNLLITEFNKLSSTTRIPERNNDLYGQYDYASVIDTIIKVDPVVVETMYVEIFNLMDNIKEVLSNPASQSQNKSIELLQNPYYGNVQLYDIGNDKPDGDLDKFISAYNKRKRDYLALTKTA